MRILPGSGRRRRVTGLTLIEVLATVLVLGLGLIMVGAAFPVGIDQTRQTVDETQATMMARGVIEMLHTTPIVTWGVNSAPGSGLASAYTKQVILDDKLTGLNDLLPMNNANPNKAVIASYNCMRVGNMERLTYLNGGSEPLTRSPVAGDLVCFPVLTRPPGIGIPPNGTLLNLNTQSFSTLFLVTVIVVVKHSAEVITSPYETYPAPTTTAPGDGVLGSDGRVYQVTGVSASGPVFGQGQPSGPTYIFHDVVAVFYTFVSG